VDARAARALPALDRVGALRDSVALWWPDTIALLRANEHVVVERAEVLRQRDVVAEM
jgi:hypothetical protein